MCLVSSSSCGFASSTGASGYIQNQNGVAQAANFWTNGSGRVDGGFEASGGAVSLNNASNFVTNINTGGSNGAVNIGSSSAGAISLYTGSASGISLTTHNASGGVKIQSATNSATAFQVQTALGGNVISIDTINSRIGVHDASPQTALQLASTDVVQIGRTTDSNYLQLTANDVIFSRNGNAYLTNEGSGGNQALRIGTGVISSNNRGITVDGNNVVGIGLSGTTWFSGFTSSLMVGGTAGGSSCGSEGCPVIQINAGATNGNRWGVGVGGTGAINFMTENSGVISTRLAISNTGTLTLPGISTGTGTVACVDGSSNLVKSATSACVNPSSIAYKDNVAGIQNALDVVGALRPVSFDWKASTGYSAANGSSRDFGFIAQEVDAVLPELVAHDPTGLATGMSYVGVIPFAIAGIQQQQQQIDHLSGLVESLQASVQAVAKGARSSQADIATANLNASVAVHTGSLTVTDDATLAALRVGGNVTIQENLAVYGTTTTQNIVVNGHVITAGDAPVVKALPAAGQSATVLIDGNDSAGTITITAGDAAGLDGDVAAVSFDKRFTKTPKIVLSASDREAATLQSYTTRQSAEGFAVGVVSQLVPGKKYSFNYFVAE